MLNIVVFVFALAGVSAAWGAVLDPADLSVSESGTPEVAGTGETVTFTVDMGNVGPSAALDATMIDVLPLGMSFASLTFTPAGAMWVCVAPPVGENGKIACINKNFAARDAVTFTISVTVDRCAGDGALANPVSASSLNPDPNYADNTAAWAPTIVDPGTCDDGNACTGGDRCAPSVGFAETFDTTAPRSLPPGWVATVVVGPGRGLWTTGNSVYDTPSISVFALDVPEITDSILDTPDIVNLTAGAQLHFMNRYDLEFAADGGVLEIKIGNAAFVDILDAGGQFESGGYDERIRGDQQSPIGGRLAWTGNSGGFKPTVIDLPPGIAGKTVVLRWRMVSDRSLGKVGQWVDSIFITGPYACAPGTPLTCDDNDACTVDSCDPVLGCQHAAYSCDDGNPCTDDTCDVVLRCVHVNNSSPCDDHDLCTLTDVCTAGACVGSSPRVCDDGDACTADSCNPATGCEARSANFDTSDFSAGRVDGRDLVVLADAWNTCPGDVRYDARVDLDPTSNCIGLDDFHLFMNAFGRLCAP